jgi:hypothetical protein
VQLEITVREVPGKSLVHSFKRCVVSSERRLLPVVLFHVMWNTTDMYLLGPTLQTGGMWAYRLAIAFTCCAAIVVVLSVGPSLYTKLGTVTSPRGSLLGTHIPINGVISTGRRTTRTESQVQGFHGLRTSATPNAKRKPPCLGKNEVQPQGVGPLKHIAKSTGQRSGASTG